MSAALLARCIMWSILFFISVTVLVHPPALFSSFFIRSRSAREARPFHPYATGNVMVSLSRFLSHLSIFSSPLSLSLSLCLDSFLSFSLFFSSLLAKLEEDKKEDQGEYTAEVIKGVGVYSWVLYPLLETPRCSRGTHEEHAGALPNNRFGSFEVSSATRPRRSPLAWSFHQPRTHSPRRGPKRARMASVGHACDTVCTKPASQSASQP